MYVITLNSGPDMLDIYPVELFRQKSLVNSRLFVVALVKTMEDARNYIVNVTARCFASRGDGLIKEYLLEADPSARSYLGL